MQKGGARNTSRRSKKELKETKIEEWTEKNGPSEDLILELAETSKLLNDLKSDLDDLPSLPEGYESSREIYQRGETVG